MLEAPLQHHGLSHIPGVSGRETPEDCENHHKDEKSGQPLNETGQPYSVGHCYRDRKVSMKSAMNSSASRGICPVSNICFCFSDDAMMNSAATSLNVVM